MFLLNPHSAMKIHAWWIHVWCETSCGLPELCCVLSYSQRLLRRTWPMLSWSWSSPIRLPEAFPPALSMPRSSLRRTSCNSMFSPVVLFKTCHPSYLWNLGNKSLFLYFHMCRCVVGNPFLMVFKVPLERCEAPLLKRAGTTTLGQIFWDKFFLGLIPEGWGLWFWEHPRKFSAEPNDFMVSSSFSGF